MYGKLYECTFTGSMYGKGAIMFATWSYVIAHTKPDNLVELNPVMLASTFGQCTPEDVEQAIETLCSPDPLSRSKKLEGRRLIKKGEFMYFIVNAARELRHVKQECQMSQIKSKTVNQSVLSTQIQNQYSRRRRVRQSPISNGWKNWRAIRPTRESTLNANTENALTGTKLVTK